MKTQRLSLWLEVDCELEAVKLHNPFSELAERNQALFPQWSFVQLITIYYYAQTLREMTM